MAYLTSTELSCGVQELIGVHHMTPEDILLEAFQAGDNRWHIYNAPPQPEDIDCAMILFSDNLLKGSGGPKLAAYIKRNKLGSIVASKIRKNPNSQNLIRVWIWHVNRKATFDWLKKKGSTEENANID